MFAGAPWRGRASGAWMPSSVINKVGGSGSPALTVNEAAIPRGGPVNAGPSGWNLMTGGVLPTPASLYGSTTQRGFKLIGIDVVLPFAVIVQINFLSPKSFGTVIVKTPHCRLGRKCVGWPRSGPPGWI